MKSNLWRLIRLVSSVGLPRLGPQTACFDSFWRRQRWWWWWFGKMTIRFIPCSVPPNVFPITAEETDSLVWFFGWENWRPAWKERWAAHADPHYLSIRVSPTTWLDKISFQHKNPEGPLYPAFPQRINNLSCAPWCGLLCSWRGCSVLRCILRAQVDRWPHLTGNYSCACYDLY